MITYATMAGEAAYYVIPSNSMRDLLAEILDLFPVPLDLGSLLILDITYRYEELKEK